jgi:hypothetical protein
MELKVVTRNMGVLINMINARRVEGRRATLNAMHHVTLCQQKVGQISAILPGDACDQSTFLHG